MPVAFVPTTAAPTHLGAFRQAPPGVPVLVSPILGVPLMPNQLGLDSRVVVEAAWGADITADWTTWTWYDITADVRMGEGRGVSIGPIGRPDEASQTVAADCTFTLLDQDGDYAAYLPTGAHYPNVRKGTPIRVRVTQDNGNTWYTRFFGSANGFTPAWDETGTLHTVKVSASGTLRRVERRTTPVDSPMVKSIQAAGPVVYHPMEDGAESTQISSGLVGGSPMTGDAATTVTFATDSTLPGSKPTLKLSSTTNISTGTAHVFDGHWQVDWYMNFSAAPSTTAETVIMRIYTSSSTIIFWDFVIGYDGATAYQAVHGYDTSFSLAVDSGHVSIWQIGNGWQHFQLTARTNGANLEWRFTNFPIFSAGITYSGSLAGSAGNVIQCYTGAALPNTYLNGASMAHLAIYDTYNQDFTDEASVAYGPWQGNEGEIIYVRLFRIADENGLTLDAQGIPEAPMGPQPIDTPLNILRECETADDGMLYDGLTCGLRYTSRDQAYNATPSLTVDMAQGHVDSFEPMDDDQRTRNLVKVDQKAGTSETVEDETGPLGTDAIGEYNGSVTVNVDTSRATDAVLQRAYWEVAKGTIEGFRYPTLGLNFGRAPALVPQWLGVTPMSRVEVLNAQTASQHPAGVVSLLVEGYSETINQLEWTAQVICSMFVPYEVFEIEGTGNRSRLDASTSTLASPVSASATTLSVATSGSPLWTTTAAHPTDFPFDVDLAGERVQVTDISGASSPQTFTVVRSVNGVTAAHAAGATVKLWKPGGLAF